MSFCEYLAKMWRNSPNFDLWKATKDLLQGLTHIYSHTNLKGLPKIFFDLLRMKENLPWEKADSPIFEGQP